MCSRFLLSSGDHYLNVGFSYFIIFGLLQNSAAALASESPLGKQVANQQVPAPLYLKAALFNTASNISVSSDSL